MDSESIKRSKSGKWCTVMGCKSQQGSMFLFPKNEAQRLQWIRACRIVKDVTNFMYICSRHFSESEMITTGTQGLEFFFCFFDLCSFVSL